MRRREMLFENPGEATTTTRGIPLILAESSETMRMQTLGWVSARQFLLHSKS